MVFGACGWLVIAGLSIPSSHAAADAFAAPGQHGVADPQTYLQRLDEALHKKWPGNRTITIVCHGHSVPAGYFKTPTVDSFNAYPHLLHKALKERYPHAVINVIVTAIGGENSISGAARFERDVLSHKPDLITIDYALNDRGAGLKKSEAAWRSMIEVAGKAGIPVILLTPTADTRSDWNQPDDPLNQHAEQVRRLAAECRVGLVDSCAAFKREVAKGTALDSLMSQINHPNRAGHDLVVAELMRWFDFK